MGAIEDPAGKPQRTAQGIAIIVGSVLMMAFSDAAVKLLSADITVWQIFVVRSMFAIPILLLVSRATHTGLRVRAPAWTLLRTALLVLTWLAFYASLPVLSLSVAAVAVYTNPIMIALLSAVVIREPVTARQWGGVLLGFLGVIAVLKPGTEAFSAFTLLPLLGAAFYALAMVLTRSKCQREAPLVLALALHASFMLVGLIATSALAFSGLDQETQASMPFLLGDWASMEVREWLWMAGLGMLSAAYFVGVARAYQIAAPSIIATFDYAYLVSAVLWAYLLFAEMPDAFMICGIVLIIMAGLLVAKPTMHRPLARNNACV